MQPTERVYTAICGGAPDRVPVMPKIWVDLAANLTGTAFCEVIEDPLTALRVIMEAGLLVGADGVRQFYFPPRRTLRENDKVFEIDSRGRRVGEIDIEGGWATHLTDPSQFNVEDPYTMVYHQYWASFNEPFVRSVEDAKRIAVPDKSFYQQIGCGDRQREVFRLAGNRIALIGDLTSATLAFHVILRGLTTAMFDMIEEPELVHACMEKGAAIAIERGKFLLDLGHKVLRLNDSVGNMSLISPENWREYIYPHMKDVCDEVHRYDPSARIYCHICGDVMPILEDLVEVGLDCIGPLDPLGAMDTAEVSRRVGDRVSLMGGVNTLSFLNKTPEQIEEEARGYMVAAGNRGGFILGSGCVVPRGASKESLQALRTAADRYGVYREGILEKT